MSHELSSPAQITTHQLTKLNICMLNTCTLHCENDLPQRMLISNPNVGAFIVSLCDNYYLYGLVWPERELKEAEVWLCCVL